MQEEVNDKTIALSVKTAKLTGTVLKVALQKFLSEMEKQKQKGKAKAAQPKQGKQTMKQLMQKNTPAGARGRFDSDSFHMFYHAPTVIFISRPEECDNSFVDIDCGIACENIALAAQGIKKVGSFLAVDR